MTAMMQNLPRRKFDVVIVGAGGSGMRASLQLARAGLKVAVLSKVFPTRYYDHRSCTTKLPFVIPKNGQAV